MDEAEVASYYEPGRGYYDAELAGEESRTLGICIADLDGGLHVAGDHDEPFALQSISKCSPTVSRSPTTVATTS